MHKKENRKNVEFALAFYDVVKTNKDWLKRILHPDNDPESISWSNHMKSIFLLTEIEIQDTPEEFKRFIKENGFLIESLKKFNLTEPLEDFNYSFARLQKYLLFAKASLFHFYYRAEANFKDVVKDDLNYNIDEYDWNKFEEDLDIIKEVNLFEQVFVFLISIFESYVLNIIKWIYIRNPKLQSNLIVNLTYNEVLNNLDNLLEIVINNKFSNYDWYNKKRELKNSNF